MYCPKCGIENLDDASFCRGCGANVSLVPQALAGRMPLEVVAEGSRHRRSRKDEDDDAPSLSKAIVKTFVGIAFILVALAVKNSWQMAGQLWWFWMLIPAAGSLGTGVAEFVRLNQQAKPNALPSSSNAYTPPSALPHAQPRASELPPRPVSDFYAPTSVTENTTKLLDKDQ